MRFSAIASIVLFTTMAIASPTPATTGASAHATVLSNLETLERDDSITPVHRFSLPDSTVRNENLASEMNADPEGYNTGGRSLFAKQDEHSSSSFITWLFGGHDSSKSQHRRSIRRRHP
ncbi:hypothetical protein GYMLUDRAFT_237708 [Collybiopsis luxurians FD-317 M1]|nr:hypothetical protein GYMLUDRAFT_237708 [Collybiopsis luxurians FD-317 M1]